MASALSFLTNGQPNTPVTLSSESSTSGPQWMQEYTQGLLTNAANQAYTGFSPDQLASFGEVEGLQGSSQPYINAATSAATAAENPSALTAAGAYLPQSSSALTTALGQATPGNVQNFINPYENDVVNASENLTNTNFTNSVLPQINDEFTANGQYGSAANERQAQLAANQLQEQEQLNAGSILGQGYSTALQGALGQAGVTENAAAELGNLGQISGGLGYESGVLGLQGGSELGSLGSEQEGLGLEGATALNTVGNQEQQYPEQQTSWLANLESGLAGPYTTGVSSSASGQTIPSTSQMGNSPLSNVLGTYSTLSGLASAFGGNSGLGTVNPGNDLSNSLNDTNGINYNYGEDTLNNDVNNIDWTSGLDSTAPGSYSDYYNFSD